MCTSVSKKAFLISTLIGSIVSFPAIAADGKEEVLLGIKINTQDVELAVATGGCTKKEDFSIEVNKGFTGNPPYLLTVRRKKPDDCKAFLPEGTVIKFSKDEIGLSGAFEITLVNKIGNTSQHRLTTDQKPINSAPLNAMKKAEETDRFVDPADGGGGPTPIPTPPCPHLGVAC